MRGSQIGPMVFLTDDSSVKRNALELCWPKGNLIYYKNINIQFINILTI